MKVCEYMIGRDLGEVKVIVLSGHIPGSLENISVEFEVGPEILKGRYGDCLVVTMYDRLSEMEVDTLLIPHLERDIVTSISKNRDIEIIDTERHISLKLNKAMEKV